MPKPALLPLLFCAATLVLACAFCATLRAQVPPPRVGWEESFADIGRWKDALMKPTSGTPMVSVEAADGCIDIVTPCGALDPSMKRPDWPEWPTNPASSFTNFMVKYDETVDFTAYHYLVVRIREKSTFMALAVNGKGTKVCYTTGVHAQDLAPLGLAGRDKVTLWGQFLNSSGHVKIDSIRLVRELSDEEKKGLIGEGISVREEKLPSQPYHGLEALNARAGRPARTGSEGSEWCVFRDASTGAEVWKMTDLDANEYQVCFNCDGSAFSVQGRAASGFHVFDWPTRTFKPVEGGLSDASPRFSTTEPDSMIIAENTWLKTDAPRQRRITIWRLNFRTGERMKIAEFEPKTWIVQELFSSPDSSKMLFGLRETPIVFLIDPEVPELDKRVREIKLPTRLKGVSLINKDTEISWYNCYTYENWIMDIATGRVGHGNGPCAGGHAAGGPHWTIGPYGELMKLLVRNGLHPQTEATADDVRIAANYRTPVHTDYGHISRDGKWMVTDGTEGDVAGQHLMISIDDPAAVLRVCKHNTSRNDWVTNTYSSTSPDATKLAWISDQLGNGDVYIAVTGRPAAPKNLEAKTWPEVKDAALLSWKAPEGCREITGYRVYGSTRSGNGFVPLHDRLIRKTNYTVVTRPWAYYLVAAVEASGIEGDFSNEVTWRKDDVGPRTFFIEAEEGGWKPPLRLVLRGEASGSRYLRVHRASKDEPAEGAVAFKPDLPAGTYSLWLRARAEGQPARWMYSPTEPAERLALDPRMIATTDSAEFRWAKVPSPLIVRAGSPTPVFLNSGTDGAALDRVAVSSDPNFDPNKSDSMTPPPEPAADPHAISKTAQSILLGWNWTVPRACNIVRYDVHHGGDPAKLGNATIIGSTTDEGSEFADWGLRPATAYTYHIVAVDSRGNRSKPVSLTVTTAAQAIQTVSSKPQAGDAPEKITFPVDVTEDAPFMLWVKYRPGYAKTFRVGVEIDGKPAGNWALRAPYRPMWWTLSAKGAQPVREFVDKILADGKDVFTLAKGRHTVTIVLDPKLADTQHVMLELTASNDHSFRPAGYDPRADFAKGPRAE